MSDEQPIAELAPSSATPEEYSTFIGQIELRNLWMHAGSAHNELGPLTPERVYLEVEDQPSYEPSAAGFICTHAYLVRANSEGHEAFRITLELKVQFDSAAPMTDRIFKVFATANLPLNTWPYLREFVASSVARMGWQALTLPALKRGVRTPSANPGATETSETTPSPKRKRRRKRTVSPHPDAD
jgi:hypothetical protein